MKVLLLSDINSEHTEKWALGLASRGIEVGLFSFTKASYNWYENQKNIVLLNTPTIEPYTESVISKFSYFKFVGPLKKCIAQFKPDVVHAHYATSYGLVGALSGFSNYVISAWGTDVMKFPQKNWLNKFILKYNLNRTKAICATSHTIESYLKQVTSKKITVIPFGVDITDFIRKDVPSHFDKGTFVIGCIKSLEKLYNIDVLIDAFYELKQKYQDKPLQLLIIGTGSEKQQLESQVIKLGLQKDVIFAGRIPFNKVSEYFNMITVLANISDYESFGVSVIEAMACERPVIATNTGGLKEIIDNDTLGTLVEIGNVQQTAQAFERHLLDLDYTLQIGKNARKKVVELYNWEDNLTQMISVYSQISK